LLRKLLPQNLWFRQPLDYRDLRRAYQFDRPTACNANSLNARNSAPITGGNEPSVSCGRASNGIPVTCALPKPLCNQIGVTAVIRSSR
jgi:hypothetical protein